ncbi:cytochrome P450, family 5, subfamily A [Xylogone sp. PMI_703]|nr:cytochrome P450, family 5, subfamily A [Xylogone sp. PMI_703]
MQYTFLIFVTSVLALTLPSCYRIARNYQQVRKHGLPVLVTPFHFLNPFWALSQQYLSPIFYYLATRLPSPFNRPFNFIHFTSTDWNFHGRYASHPLPFQYYCPAFFIVSPGDTHIVINDPDAADNIMSRIRKDFIKSRDMYGPLEVFGPNVDTLNGDDWARHRRITAPPFNERNSAAVWKESLRQATAMLRSWTEEGIGGVTTLANDIMTLALHVLTAAGFGKTYEFTSGVQGVTEGYSMSYRDALKIVLAHLKAVIITNALPPFLIPRAYQGVRTAATEFKKHMVEMVEDERRRIKDDDGSRDNLMSVLLRSAQSETEGKARSALSNDEILGNLFIYNLAGHDTTANTLAYAITALSIEPELQDWIAEEINTVLGGRANVKDWDYESDFPRLNRCLALMYETLRLYGPVTFIPKYTGELSPSLTIQSKTYALEPRTYVVINCAALHTNPEYWGPDALEFRPGRFIKLNGTGIGDEQLLQPPPGNFVPWASGPRVCPGKKFAQVEFVAVIARLFMKHRVEAKPMTGETGEMTVERVKDCLLDSSITITLSMRHPERVPLVWKERA